MDSASDLSDSGCTNKECDMGRSGKRHVYQSDIAAALREITGKTAIPEFQQWLEKMGFVENGRLTKKAGDGSVLLY